MIGIFSNIRITENHVLQVSSIRFPIPSMTMVTKVDHGNHRSKVSIVVTIVVTILVTTIVTYTQIGTKLINIMTIMVNIRNI